MLQEAISVIAAMFFMLTLLYQAAETLLQISSVQTWAFPLPEAESLHFCFYTSKFELGESSKNMFTIVQKPFPALPV